MNIGLFGFTNKHYYLATKTQEKYTKPFGSDGSLSPLDYSVGIGTGLELGHFQFMFGYDYPLSNSSKDPDLRFTNKHYYLATKTQEKYTKPFGSDGSLSPLDYV
ncbi:hypothetical protein [Escherichia coli]|uniref:hypothetical protein n=9 Tax=Gammaproteobacteria TaxID=1236 RepID=UPI001596BBCE|nr:hypothetical protein [Escherichia coli]